MNNFFESVLDIVKEGMEEKPVETLIGIVGVTTIYAILKAGKR